MSGAHDDAVHHHVDVVLELLVERRRVVDLVERAVDLHALEAALLQVGDLLAVLALAAAHDRREQVEPRLLRQRQHAVDHLADGLALDRQAGRRRIGHADARPEQAHVVVDLGDRADGRARVLARSSSARWRWPATGRRSGRRPASASSPGTGAHRPTGSRHSGAGPRRRSCRRRATTCPSRTGPVNTTSLSRGMSRSTFLRLCSRAPRIAMTRWSVAAGRRRPRSNRSSIDGHGGLLSRGTEAVRRRGRRRTRSGLERGTCGRRVDCSGTPIT